MQSVTEKTCIAFMFMAKKDSIIDNFMNIV